MAKRIVKTPFRLTLDDGTVKEFAAGSQEIDKSLLDHWFVVAHLEPEQEETPEPVNETEQEETPEPGNRRGRKPVQE